MFYVVFVGGKFWVLSGKSVVLFFVFVDVVVLSGFVWIDEQLFARSLLSRGVSTWSAKPSLRCFLPVLFFLNLSG